LWAILANTGMALQGPEKAQDALRGIRWHPAMSTPTIASPGPSQTFLSITIYLGEVV